MYLDKLVLWLAIEHDISISVSALHATLWKIGLTRKLLHKIAIECDEQLREQWKAMIASDTFLPDGSQFIFLDETSKNEHTLAQRYGRVFVQGDRYSLLAALSTKGYIGTTVVPGSFDSMDFLEFVQEQVVRLSIILLHCPYANIQGN